MSRTTALMVLVVAVAVGCGKDKKVDKLEETQWCADELTKTIVPELVKTYDGGDADEFHRATVKFTQGTMCGPDFAGFVRGWELTLHDTDPTSGPARRKALVAELRDSMKPTAEYDWAPEQKALAPLFEKAK